MEKIADRFVFHTGNLSLVGLFEAGDNRKQGGFTTAGRTEQGDDVVGFTTNDKPASTWTGP